MARIMGILMVVIGLVSSVGLIGAFDNGGTFVTAGAALAFAMLALIGIIVVRTE